MIFEPKTLGATEFISYSANQEDVLLRRLFPESKPGFYVDVGAAHPIWESDTKALRDRGWRGINIEPQEYFLTELRRERPDDVNVGVGLSDVPGTLTFFEIEGTGLSTFNNQNATLAHRKGYRVKSRTVPVLTLAQVLADNDAPPEFELLKVDVEGSEQAVLSGNDWLRFRPRVVLVEATVPETPIRREDGCRALLNSVGWRHAWFDGLNDWYLAPDFTPQTAAFEAPPNIFDRFITRRTAEAEARLTSLRSELAAATTQREMYSEALIEVNADTARHKKALSQVQNDLVSTRREVAHARAESNHFRELMEQSAAALAEARAQLTAALADAQHTRFTLVEIHEYCDKLVKLTAVSKRPGAVQIPKPIRRELARQKLTRNYEAIASSPLFDAAWYLAANRDVAARGIDPAYHYLMHGAAEARDPGPYFDTDSYLSLNQDVAAARVNALLHFVQFGAAEDRLVSTSASRIAQIRSTQFFAKVGSRRPRNCKKNKLGGIRGRCSVSLSRGREYSAMDCFIRPYTRMFLVRAGTIDAVTKDYLLNV